jgi:hypothetical protein
LNTQAEDVLQKTHNGGSKRDNPLVKLNTEGNLREEGSELCACAVIGSIAAESFVFRFAVQKCTEGNVQNYIFSLVVRLWGIVFHTEGVTEAEGNRE